MARVSVLQLDTRFCRVPGDVGCAESYLHYPEIIRVPCASVANIVTDQPGQIDLDPFLNAIERATGDVVKASISLTIWPFAMPPIAGLQDI